MGSKSVPLCAEETGRSGGQSRPPRYARRDNFPGGEGNPLRRDEL